MLVKIRFLIFYQNICYGYIKEESNGDGSHRHSLHILRLMGNNYNYKLYNFAHLNPCLYVSS